MPSHHKKKVKWNEVTPLSKYLAMALFIAMPFIGFYLGMQYQKMSTPAYPPTDYTFSPYAPPIKPLNGAERCGGVAAKLCKSGYTCRLETTDIHAAGTCVPASTIPTPASTEVEGGVQVKPTTAINEPVQVACTQDAKLCSDGSYVGRTGPNCEFAACPNE